MPAPASRPGHRHRPPPQTPTLTAVGGLRRASGRLLPHAALFAGYVLLAAYAERFAVTPDASLSVWYPPPGLVLVVFQRWGLRFWPAESSPAG